eukprot:2549208-Pyramimonas_sp.AAC.1
MNGAALRVTEEALRAVAAHAIKHKTGARGLRAILEGVLADAMFEVPDAAPGEVEGVVLDTCPPQDVGARLALESSYSECHPGGGGGSGAT